MGMVDTVITKTFKSTLILKSPSTLNFLKCSLQTKQFKLVALNTFKAP